MHPLSITVGTWDKYAYFLRTLETIEYGWHWLTGMEKARYQAARTGLGNLHPHQARPKQTMPAPLYAVIRAYLQTGDAFEREMGVLEGLQFSAGARPGEPGRLRNIDCVWADESPEFAPPGASYNGERGVLFVNLRGRKNAAAIGESYWVRCDQLTDELAYLDVVEPLRDHVKRHGLALSSQEKEDLEMVRDGFWPKLRPDQPGRPVFVSYRAGMRDVNTSVTAGHTRKLIQKILRDGLGVRNWQDFSGYSYRSGAVTTLLAAGMNNLAVSKHVGHANAAAGTTFHYYQSIALDTVGESYRTGLTSQLSGIWDRLMSTPVSGSGVLDEGDALARALR